MKNVGEKLENLGVGAYSRGRGAYSRIYSIRSFRVSMNEPQPKIHARKMIEHHFRLITQRKYNWEILFYYNILKY